MGYLLIRPQAKYCSSDLYMYEVGHGSAEASEEIQASTVYISTQTASDIYQTHRGIELFQDFSRRKSSKINTFQLTRLFSMQYLIATLRSSYRATCIKRSEEIQGESG